MAEVFYDRWKKAKATFEAKTGKKKPESASTLGKLVNKMNSSGLEGSLKAFDAAKNPKDALKAAKSFEKAANDYLPTLAKAQIAAKKEGNDVYSDACLELSAYLEKISAKVTAAIDRFKGFPDNLDAVFASSYWMKKFQKFCKKEFASENYDFLEEYKKGRLKFNKKYIEEFYNTYIERNSPKELNIKASTLKKVKESYNESLQTNKWTKFPYGDIHFDVMMNACDTYARFSSAYTDGDA